MDKKESLQKRCLTFEKCENFRQLGGYVTQDGRRVKWGKLYRTSHLISLTAQERVIVAGLGIDAILDLRSDEEVALAPDPSFDGVRRIVKSALVNVAGEDISFDLETLFLGGVDAFKKVDAYVSQGYVRMPFGNEAYQAMFDELRKGSTLLFHCTAGKDRTGIAAMLILLTLDVPYQTILDDFMLTNVCRAHMAQQFAQQYATHVARIGVVDGDELFREITGVRAENLKMAYDAIFEKYPSFDAFLQAEYGVTEAEREQIKDFYLES
ncbi:MAG: tyrosine-protein phosphatase [Oscillospiraceae bacterium]|nr:tyrosine-protein phosphatase [Oscillospiraceae bacterium]